MSRKLVFILTHILGSGIFLFLPVISSPDFSADFSFLDIPPFQRDFLSYLLLLGFFYTNYYVLVPRFYLHRRWLWFILSIAGCYLLIGFLPSTLIGENHPGPGMQNSEPGNRLLSFFGRYSFQFLGVGLFSLFLRIFSQWKQMEQEKTSMELRYLRAQINPHFLFNTLNVIYSSAIVEKAPKTATSLIQLSDMLRHVLNESQKEYIPLEKEMEYIRSYLALQEQRCGTTTTLSVEITGNFSGNIPPLLLIPFIENAFKYGVSPEEQSTITISIKAEDNRLTLETHNDKVRRQHVLTEQSGIGVQNTINRLNHLYEGDYSLTIRDKEHSFDVLLILPLKP